MARKKNQIDPTTIIGWTIFSSMTLISPFITFDAVNPFKLATIVLGSALSLYLLLQEKVIHNLNYFTVTVISTIFVATLSSLSAVNSFTENLFGDYGRSMGLLAFISCMILFYCAKAVSSMEVMSSIVDKVYLAAGIAAVYGLFQFLNLDPLSWNNSNNRIVGFLANPNFQSAFLGMVAGSSLLFVIQKRTGSVVKSLLLLNIPLSALLIVQSDSQQGIMTFGIALATGLLLKIRYSEQKDYLKVISYVSVAFAFFVALLDILQRAPWKSFLYQQSISFRGDFWRTGVEIIQTNPFTGTGFNGYSTWYERTRDLKSLGRVDSNLISNSAHNIFLDLGVIGGLPLLLLFLILLMLALIKIVKFQPVSGQNHVSFIIVASLWTSWLAYSFISPMQISLFCLGMILTGLIIGYDTSRRSTQTLPQSNSSPRILVKIMGLAIPFIMVTATLPYIYRDHVYLRAQQAKNIEMLERSLLIWPQDSNLLASGSEIMSNSGFEDLAKKLALKATVVSPENSRSWKVLYKLRNLNSIEKQEAKRKIIELDPNFRFSVE
jgi:O-antigen ligase